MKGSYSVGGQNEIFDLYGEQCSFDGDDTPVHLRKKGLWPINRFTKGKRFFKQNRTPAVNWNGAPAWPPTEPTARVLVTVNTVASPPVNSADVLSKLAGQWRQTDLNVGMYLSPEGRESAEMVYETMLRMANSARSLKRGDFGGFVRGLNHLPRSARRESLRKFEQGDLSGSFLSAHLGWSPLIGDIYNLSDNIRPIDSSMRRLSAQKKVKRNEVTFSPSSNSFGFEAKVITNKQQLRYTLDVTNEPNFSERFGLNNPFMIAWELVPLSFVADYFLPIGSTIDALGFISAVRGKGFIKEYSELQFTLRIPKMSLINQWQWTFNRDELNGHYGYSSFKRTPWTPSFGDPFRSISVSVPTSLMRISTMTALLHQRLIGLSR